VCIRMKDGGGIEKTDRPARAVEIVLLMNLGSEDKALSLASTRYRNWLQRFGIEVEFLTRLYLPGKFT
jgi:hypothetical protein